MGACQGTPDSAWGHIPQAESRPSPLKVIQSALQSAGDEWPRSNALIAVEALFEAGYLIRGEAGQ